MVWRIWEIGFRGETNRTSHYDNAKLHIDKVARIRPREGVRTAGINFRLVANAI